MAPPPAAPAPLPPDPLAVSLTAAAHSAALRGDCEQVEQLAFRTRSLAPDYYREHFATDRVIIACDPRALRAERAAAELAGAAHATGALVGIDLAIDRVPVAANPSLTGFVSNDAVLAPRTRAYVGYQGRAIAVGGTLQLARASLRDTSDPSNPQTQTQTLVALGPMVRVRLYESAGKRVELLLAGDVALGSRWTTLDPDPGMTTPSADFVAFAHAGVALRYWLAPSFALGATGGFAIAYQDNHAQTGFGGTESNAATTATSVDVALSVTGVL